MTQLYPTVSVHSPHGCTKKPTERWTPRMAGIQTEDRDGLMTCPGYVVR